MDNKVLAFDLHEVTVYMYAKDYESGRGALMPTPTHVLDTLGMGASYAHMFDGTILRYRVQIGVKSDLVPITETDLF